MKTMKTTKTYLLCLRPLKDSKIVAKSVEGKKQKSKKAKNKKAEKPNMKTPPLDMARALNE